METTIKIENLKCGGCANTITKNLKAIDGVENIGVLVDEEEIHVTHSEKTDITAIKQKLKSLGYPVKGTSQGFEKITENIKSYVSCAIGKLSDN